MAASRHLNPSQFSFYHEKDEDAMGPGVDSHAVYAYHPDFGEYHVGQLYWRHDKAQNKHTIDLVGVYQDHRRQGIGTKMYEEAQKHTGGQPLWHGSVRTPDGKYGGGNAWAHKVGGPITGEINER